MTKKLAVWSWLVVAAVGLLVVVLVFALNLFGRLNAAQTLIDDLNPAFTAERVAGDRAGIDVLSAAVDTVDPVITAEGGASAEVPQLISFVSRQTGLSEAAVLNALKTNFPKTTGLLTALPLSDVSAEIPRLVQFLATTLKLSPDQVLAALQQNFPKLAQAVTNLPKATAGWNKVPGTENLTRFDGSPVNTVPQIRDYFSQDVIPVLESQQEGFRALDTRGGVGFLAPLLLILGIIVIVFGILMAVLAGSSGGLPKPIALTGWAVVAVVGVVVVLLVFALNLFTRLGGGQEVLDTARPAFAAERVAGDVAAIEMVDTVVKTFDPVVTEQGGAAAEVPKLVGFVSQQAGLTQPQVLAALQQNFPKTLGLLTALPLSGVTAELPKLVDFLVATLKVSPEVVAAALRDAFPKISQAVANLPKVTAGWNNVPNAEGLTRFDGSPVTTVPQVATYFKQDVIPAVGRQQANFVKVDTTWPPLTVFAPLLLVLGIIVVVYGLLMLLVTRRSNE